MEDPAETPRNAIVHEEPEYLRGRRLHRFGAILFWCSLTLFVLCGIPLGRFFGWAGFAVSWVPFALIVVGLASMRRARTLMAASGEHLLAVDRRPPVIYLRPFDSDSLGTRVVTRFLGFRYFTEEEQLAMVMNEIGPFLAIGDPRDTVADLGAARIYVPDGGWQRKVSDLIAKAGLVLLRAGTSQGFWYELEAVRTSVSPLRVLLLVPANRHDYGNFRARAVDALPHPLPNEIDVGTRPLLGSVGGVIEFDEAWRPRALPVVRAAARTSFVAPYASRLKLTLKPVFERLGLTWSAPPAARARWTIGISSLVLGLLAGLFWAALQLPYWLYDPRDYPASETVVPETEPDVYDRVTSELGTRLGALPEFRAATGSARNALDARRVGRELSQMGMKRLSDERLLQHATLLRRMLSVADEPTCAGMMRGSLSDEGALERTIRRLDPPEIELFYEVVYDAVLAELQQHAIPPPPPQTQVDLAFQSLLAGLPSRESKQLLSALSDPQEASDAAACGAVRSLYSMLDLAEPQRHILVRAFIAEQ